MTRFDDAASPSPDRLHDKRAPAAARRCETKGEWRYTLVNVGRPWEGGKVEGAAARHRGAEVAEATYEVDESGKREQGGSVGEVGAQLAAETAAAAAVHCAFPSLPTTAGGGGGLLTS